MSKQVQVLSIVGCKKPDEFFFKVTKEGDKVVGADCIRSLQVTRTINTKIKPHNLGEHIHPILFDKDGNPKNVFQLHVDQPYQKSGGFATRSNFDIPNIENIKSTMHAVKGDIILTYATDTTQINTVKVMVDESVSYCFENLADAIKCGYISKDAEANILAHLNALSDMFFKRKFESRSTRLRPVRDKSPKSDINDCSKSFDIRYSAILDKFIANGLDDDMWRRKCVMDFGQTGKDIDKGLRSGKSSGADNREEPMLLLVDVRDIVRGMFVEDPEDCRLFKLGLFGQFIASGETPEELHHGLTKKQRGHKIISWFDFRDAILKYREGCDIVLMVPGQPLIIKVVNVDKVDTQFEDRSVSEINLAEFSSLKDFRYVQINPYGLNELDSAGWCNSQSRYDDVSWAIYGRKTLRSLYHWEDKADRSLLAIFEQQPKSLRKFFAPEMKPKSLMERKYFDYHGDDAVVYDIRQFSVNFIKYDVERSVELENRKAESDQTVFDEINHRIKQNMIAGVDGHSPKTYMPRVGIPREYIEKAFGKDFADLDKLKFGSEDEYKPLFAIPAIHVDVAVIVREYTEE